MKKLGLLSMILCSLLIILFSGCKTSDKNTDNAQDITISASEPSITPQITEEVPKVLPTTTPTIAPTISPTIGASDGTGKQDKNLFDTLSGFKKLQDSFLAYNFTIVEEGSESISQTFMGTGQYDLNKDGQIDDITIKIDCSKDNQSYLKVNDAMQEFNIVSLYDGEVKIVDLDQNDNYFEVACFDAGPSDDPIYVLFRYDGNTLYQMGSIDAFASIDEHGKLISGFHIARQFEPSFYSAWYEIEHNTLVRKNNDIEPYLGLTYNFIGGDAFFQPMEEVTENVELSWEGMRSFDPGKVEIIDILSMNETDRILNFYFVKFQSGEKGLLYFWIGD